MHGDQTTMIIDDFVAGDYGAAAETATQATDHMGMIAQILYDGRAQ